MAERRRIASAGDGVIGRNSNRGGDVLVPALEWHTRMWGRDPTPRLRRQVDAFARSGGFARGVEDFSNDQIDC